MRLRSLVWNATERRPRAPVRFLLATVLLVVLFVGLALLVATLPSEVESFVPSLGLALVAAALPGVVAVAAALAVDRRTLTDLGLGVDRDWMIDFAFGLGLGAVLMTGVFLVALVAGWVRVVGLFAAGSSPGGFAGGFAALTALFLVVGVSEELVARGYVLTNVAEGLAGYLTREQAVAVAVLASSLLFGVAHLRNPGATPLSTLGITAAGVFLAVGFVLTGDLAIPAGVHVSWNLFQGGVYGFAVSGLGVGTAVVDTDETGPDLVTGGAFGPEAGLLGLAAVVVGVAATVAYVRWRYDGAAPATGPTVPTLR